MVGIVLSGKEVSAEVRAELKKRVEKLRNNDPQFLPALVIVQVRQSGRAGPHSASLLCRWAAGRTAMFTSG